MPTPRSGILGAAGALTAVLGGWLVYGALTMTLTDPERAPEQASWQVLRGALGVLALALGAAWLPAIGPAVRARLGAVLTAGGRLGPADGARIGAVAGFATGVLEVAQIGVQKYGYGVRVRQPADVLWMAPLGDAAVMAIVGAVVGAIGLWSAAVRLPLLGGVLGWLSAWSLLVTHGALHFGARALLMLGAAVAGARVAAACDVGLRRVARRCWPWLLAGTVVVAVGMAALRYASERRQIDALPAAPAGATNILLIVLDTVRADHLGTHGYHRATSPFFDEIAQNAVVFERAIATSPWTVPTHVSLLTGCYPHETSASFGDALDGEVPTLAERLAARGYATGGFVGNLFCCGAGWGFARGFHTYDDFPVSLATVAVTAGAVRAASTAAMGSRFTNLLRNDAPHVIDRFLAWLPQRGERPFFAFLNLFDAHALYLPPPDYEGRFGPHVDYLHDWYRRDDWSAAEVRGFVDAYDACIRFIDDELRRLFNELERRGLLADTLVVITGDHGEQFGEHGLFDHGNSLYQPLLHEPLVFSFPGRLAGRRIARRVSLRDVARTMLDLSGNAEVALPGVALLDANGADTGRGSNVLAQLLGSGCIYRDQWHFILNSDGRRELYDRDLDPDELDDLAATERGAPVADRLQRLLIDTMRGVAQPR